MVSRRSRVDARMVETGPRADGGAGGSQTYAWPSRYHLFSPPPRRPIFLPGVYLSTHTPLDHPDSKSFSPPQPARLPPIQPFRSWCGSCAGALAPTLGPNKA